MPVLANARCKVLMGQCLRSNGGLFYHGYAEFAEGLRLLLGEPGLAEALGRQGRDYVEREYSWETIDAKMEDLFAGRADSSAYGTRRRRGAAGGSSGPRGSRGCGSVLALQVEVELQAEAVEAAGAHEGDPDRVAQDLLAAVAVEAEVDAQVGEALQEVLRDLEGGLPLDLLARPRRRAP